MLTVKGTACSMAEEVAHEERERRCERLIRLHGSGRRVVQVMGTGAHHQNGLVERANQTMDKAIRAMLIGAGLSVKFWPYAFRHFLGIKNSALP